MIMVVAYITYKQQHQNILFYPKHSCVLYINEGPSLYKRETFENVQNNCSYE